MDETSLRVQLERALSDEPPLGNVVGSSLRAGRKLRSRRRTGIVAAATAAVAVVIAIPAVLSGAGKPQPAAAPGPRFAYVAVSGNKVVPINLATNAVGKPIKAHTYLLAATTPDGRTVYEVGYASTDTSQYDLVTPINTATNKTGPVITLPGVPCPAKSLVRQTYCSLDPTSIAISPDGRTAYVAVDGGVYPINLVRHSAGKLISIPAAAIFTMAFAPDGKTLYVVNPFPTMGADDRSLYPPEVATPIRTGTNTALASIKIPLSARAQGVSGPTLSTIAITPNGKTAYVVAGVQQGKPYENSVIPIDLATNKALAPIRLKASGLAEVVLISPGGGIAYVQSARAVTPINTATNKAGPAISLPDSIGYANDMEMTPDGKTLYVISPRGVIPIRTATRTVLPMIKLPSFTGTVLTPDGKTIYAVTSSGLIPISTATNKLGKLINVGGLPGPMVFGR